MMGRASALPTLPAQSAGCVVPARRIKCRRRGGRDWAGPRADTHTGRLPQGQSRGLGGDRHTGRQEPGPDTARRDFCHFKK